MSTNNVPVVIAQMADNLHSNTTPEHIKFNYMNSLVRIRDYCDRAIKQYERLQTVKRQDYNENCIDNGHSLGCPW